MTDRKPFLDGLRGWAALVVVAYHATHCFAIAPAADSAAVLRFLSNGPLAVYIFFVLSGFALSTGFIERGDRGIILAQALRRYPRLTVPILASSALAALLMASGLMFNIPAAALAGSQDWLGIHYAFAPDLPGLLAFSLFNVYFDGDAPINYNAVLWTMPIELAGSMIVFASLFLAGRARWRPLLILGLVPVFVALSSHQTAFAFGILLAEAYARPWFRRWRGSAAAGAVAVAAVGLAFAMATTRGAAFTSAPAMSVIALLIVFAVVACRTLAGLFETPLSCWLGRLSFPVYLTHLIVICSFSSWCYLELSALGVGGGIGAGFTAAITFAASLAAATLFEPVERLAVTLARQVSDLALSGSRPATDRAVR